MANMVWPTLSYANSKDSFQALHLWSQIVGKYRLAHTPWLNHSWHATFYVTPHGLTTGPIEDSGQAIEIHFDFARHELLLVSSSTASASFPLQAMSVADFSRRFKNAISELNGTPVFHGTPNEVIDPVPFDADHQCRPYDRKAVEDLHAALVNVDAIFRRFRTGFIGKCSPVHLFWGAFDLAVTRFSGRRAPRHPGGIPNLPDAVTREAYSHEVSSAGFWPGGNGVDEAMFYSYVYPESAGFSAASLEDGYYDKSLREFLLPYATVRQARDPEAVLLRFLSQTYKAAAAAGNWNSHELDCAPGKERVPRQID